MIQCSLQLRAWSRICIKIPITGQFLCHTDSLEVHPKDGRDWLCFRASMVFARNLVEDGLHFQVVIWFCSADSDRYRSNFWCIKICDAFTRWPIYEVISRVLIGPGGVQSSLLCDLKNGVNTEEAMWVDRCTALTAVKW